MVTRARRIGLHVGAAIMATLLWLALPVCGPAAAGQPLTVVELFSAQGCPLCPPAEAYLGELAMREDVLPLAFHVDYWDYLGWADGFAAPAFVRRQQRYAALFGLPYVYTPQLVIDGVRQVSGGHRAAADAAIAAAKADAHDAVEVSVSRLSANRLRIRVPKTAVDGTPLDIVLVGFDEKHATRIGRGENAGIMLVNYRVVRDVKAIASWDGAALDVTVPLMDGQGSADYCAVLVQEAGQGRIRGAATVDMRGD